MRIFVCDYSFVIIDCTLLSRKISFLAYNIIVFIVMLERL